MRTGLLKRRRVVLDQEIQEPTLLAVILAGIGFLVLLVACVVGIAGLPVLGFAWWVFAFLAAMEVWLVLRDRRRSLQPTTVTGRQRWCRRLLSLSRKLFIGLLACWLGLIAWSLLGPGGAGPPAKTDPALIRVITWNIHCGQDDGPPWQQFDWPVRKRALRTALDQAEPDVLCVQEARPQQVAFLEKWLPHHSRIGVGRDDGRDGGEHCAIFFDRERFALLDSDTFWLEEPIDQPRLGSALDIKRICTWARLRDRVSGRTLRIYNTHLYLTELPRMSAVRVILAQIAGGAPEDAVLLTADFNASPGVPSRRLFREAGLTDSAERAGKATGKPTFHLSYGIGLWCLDGILTDSHWRVSNHLVLDVKPHNTWPSDHFAVLADLDLRQ